MPRFYANLMLIALVGCGDAPRKDSPRNDTPRSDTPRSDTPRNEAPQNEAPRNAEAKPSAEPASVVQAVDANLPQKLSAEAVAALGLSAALTGANGQARCADILSQGVYNRTTRQTSDSAKRLVTHQYCRLDEGDFADKVYKYRNEEGSSSSSSSTEAGGGLNVIGIFEIGGHGANSESSSNAHANTREDAVELVRRWRESNCGADGYAASTDLAESLAVESVDKDIVAAWRACMTEARFGLICESKMVDGLTTFSVEWQPNEIQRKHLPQVSLRWNNAENLTTSAQKIPDQLAAGGALSVTFAVVDPLKATAIEVHAGDADELVSFGCSAVSPARQRKAVKRDARCGVETYKSGRSQVCGTATFKEGVGSACGVGAYKVARSAACGVDMLKEGTGAVCGVDTSYVDLKQEDVLIAFGFGEIIMNQREASGQLHATCENYRSFFDVIFDTLGEAHAARRYEYDRWYIGGDAAYLTCRLDSPRTCRDEAFGVETYKECRDPSHGVETFSTCRDESFGVESWGECRDASFGVERYKECEVVD